MPTISDDLVGTVELDVSTRLATLRDFSTPSLYIYSPASLDTDRTRITLPASMHQYAGITADGGKHKIIFDVFILIKSEALTKVVNSRLASSSELLHRIRAAFFCGKTPTGYKWELESELPDTTDDDFLLYRQRWVTITQGIR